MTSSKSSPPIVTQGYNFIVVLFSFLVVMMVGGAQYSFGVFFKPLVNEFGWTRAATSGVYSLYLIMFGFLSILAGRAADRFGPRILVTFGGFTVGLSFWLMSQVREIWQIYLIYGVLLAIGMSFSLVPVLNAIVKWFSKSRGLVTGVVLSGAGFGTALLPPLATHLIQNFGWQTSYVILGLIALVIIAASAQFLKRGSIRSGVVNNAPDYNTANASHIQSREFSLRDVIRIKQFWIIASIFFFSTSSVYAVMVHLVPYVTDMGISQTDAAMVLSLIGWMSIICKIGLGKIGDIFGTKRGMIIAVATSIISFLWIQAASELWMLCIFSLSFAIGYGGEAALKSTIIAEYFGLKAHGELFGLLQFVSMIGGAFGPFLAGYIFDVSGSYYWIFSFYAFTGIICLLLLLVLKPVRQ